MYSFVRLKDNNTDTTKDNLKLLKPKDLLNLKLYFVSEKSNLNKLNPRIPQSIVEDVENNNIKRVCFAPSIVQCLQAINAEKSKEYYVYVPKKNLINYKIWKCQTKDVPYADLTDEYWCLDSIEVEPLYKIKVTQILPTNTFKYDEVYNYKILEVYVIEPSNILADFAKLKEVKYVKEDQNDLNLWLEFKDYKEARKFATMCKRELNEHCVEWINNIVYYTKI